MLIFGTRHMGKVDEVPGYFYVATRCRHLWYLPLVPLDSWVIVDGTRRFNVTGGEWTSAGVRLPSIRWWSVVAAWLRWFFVCIALVSGVTGLVALLDVLFDGANARGPLLRIGVAAGALVALAVSYRVSRASHSRAQALCTALALPEEVASEVRRAVTAR